MFEMRLRQGNSKQTLDWRLSTHVSKFLSKLPHQQVFHHSEQLYKYYGPDPSCKWKRLIISEERYLLIDNLGQNWQAALAGLSQV